MTPWGGSARRGQRQSEPGAPTLRPQCTTGRRPSRTGGDVAVPVRGRAVPRSGDEGEPHVNRPGPLHVLRRRWVSILAVAVLGLLASLAYVQSAQVTYQARASVFFSLVSGNSASDLVQGSTYAQNQVESFAELARTPEVLEPVIEVLGLDVRPADLAGRIDGHRADEHRDRRCHRHRHLRRAQRRDRQRRRRLALRRRRAHRPEGRRGPVDGARHDGGRGRGAGRAGVAERAAGPGRRPAPGARGRRRCWPGCGRPPTPASGTPTWSPR